MAKANHTVDVYFEAIPFSDNYYQLTPSEKAHVNALLLVRLNELVPLQQQLGWRQIPAPNTDYDDILQQINTRLTAELVAPMGKQLVLAQPTEVFWVRTELGHQILFFARLSDQNNGSVATWDFSVPYQTANYDARVGVKYECTKV